MYKKFANTAKKPCNILVGVYCQTPTNVRLMAVDPYKKGAIYMDRQQVVEGEQDFEISTTLNQ